jgi:serine/threonine protein kinase
MELAARTRLGRYEVVAPLGAGAMGEVYRARDTQLDRSVAIKVLAAGGAGSKNHADRFQREARAISRLHHPHICTLYDVGEGDAAVRAHVPRALVPAGP